MKILKAFTAVLALLFIFSLTEAARAEMVTIYGPVYIAKGNKADIVKNTQLGFTAPVPGDGVVVIRNGGDSGKKHRVSSAKIKFNDKKIAGPKDFNKKVEELRYDVQLLADNELEVKIKSCKKCELEISVLGEGTIILPTRMPSR